MLVVAHRGYSARYRENSPEAWRRAVEAEADFIEIDVRFTADWQCLCLHDADLVRLAGRAEKIAGVPYADIAGLEAGGEPLAPRLLTAFEVIPPSTGIMLDVKDERPQALIELGSLLAGAGSRPIVLGLHEARSVATMTARGDEALLALTPQPELGRAFMDAGCTLLRLWERDLTPEALAEAADRHVPVWVTAGGRGTDRDVGDIDPETLNSLAALTIEGVLVNDPAMARAALATQSSDQTTRRIPS